MGVPVEAPADPSLLRQLAGGLRELLARRELLLLVLLGAAFNLLYGGYAVVAQPYVLSFADEGTLGGLYGAFAVGLLAGGAASGRLGARGLLWPMVGVLALLGSATAASGLLPSVPWVAGCWLAAGFGLALLGSLSTTLLQRSTPAERHGRLFAAVQLLAWCAIPIGQIGAGWLSDRVFGLDRLGALVCAIGVALVVLAALASRTPALWRLEAA
ncbi:MAG: MFS transporter [Myxococcota bacterium]